MTDGKRPFSGKALVIANYNALEMRLLAHLLSSQMSAVLLDTPPPPKLDVLSLYGSQRSWSPTGRRILPTTRAVPKSTEGVKVFYDDLAFLSPGMNVSGFGRWYREKYKMQPGPQVLAHFQSLYPPRSAQRLRGAAKKLFWDSLYGNSPKEESSTYKNLLAEVKSKMEEGRFTRLKKR